MSGRPLRARLFGLFLRQYIEHKNAANLRIHVLSNGVLWTALVTVLSQIPLPLAAAVPSQVANLGAVYAIASAAYWAPFDLVVPCLVLAWTAAWASAPFAPWGPGHGWLAGVVIPLVALTAAGLAALFSHLYYDEHAPYLDTGDARADALETTHAVFWGPFYFWLSALLVRGYRPGLRAELDVAERARIARHVRGDRTLSVPQSLDDLCALVRETASAGRPLRLVGSGFKWDALAPSREVVVFCERLDRVELDRSEPRQPAIWIDCGAPARSARRVVARGGLRWPPDVLPGPGRVAGRIPWGEPCVGVETIDDDGVRHVTLGVTREPPAGVVARVRLRLDA